MRLFEIATPPVYLHSQKEHAPGTLVRPGQFAGSLAAQIEGWLEKGRPEGCLSRESSIFLQDRPAGTAPYVYLVKPIGSIERGSTGWISMLTGDTLQDRPLIEAWVASYWAGADCPTVPGAWEYRAERVRIVRLIGGKATKRHAEQYDWLKAV